MLNSFLWRASILTVSAYAVSSPPLTATAAGEAVARWCVSAGRADASVAALHRNRRVEAELDGLRMRCTHGRAGPVEPDTKRQRTDLEPSHCDWRGKVAEYRAHLTECPFEPYKCEDCGEMVARREKEAHAAVCKITCPFFGCSHKCTRAEMAQHHVDCADVHARAAAKVA